MKKLVIFCLALVLGLAIFGLTACRNNDVELSFAWWGGDMRAEQTEEVVALFEEYSETVTYVETEVNAWGDYWDAILIRAGAGDLPDVMQQDVGRLVEFTSSNLLVDMRPFIEDNRLDFGNIPQLIIDQGRVPGSDGIYAIPIGMNVIAMVYNASLLEELGLSAPRNMTLAQFIDLCRAIYEQSGVRTNFIGTDPSIQMEVLLRARGINLFEGTNMGGTAADYVEYFALIQQGIEEGWHIRPEHLEGRDGSEMNSMWYPPGEPNMRSWNSMVWSNMVNGYINDSPADMRINMTTYPSSNPQRSSFGRASMFLSMTTQSDNLDAAAEFISFWMNSVEAHSIMRGERGVIVNPVVAEAVSHLLDEGPRMQTEFVSWINNGNSSPFNPMRAEGAAEVVAELLRLTNLVASGEMSPEDAAQAIFTFGNDTLR